MGDKSLQMLHGMYEKNTELQTLYIENQRRLTKILEQSLFYSDSGLSLVDNKSPSVIWSREELVNITAGRLSDSFGEKYKAIDQYPIRARMPLPPFMFVSRVTGLEASFGELASSKIEMEYDIPDDAWYLCDGCVPYTILNESSHCGILLLSYIGVDILFDGKLSFRAIDSSVTVHSTTLVKAGDTIKGVFAISSVIRTTEKVLVFFTYNLFNQFDEHLTTIKGVGGFFLKGRTGLR